MTTRNAQQTIAAAIQKLEAIRTVPPTVWTIGPYAPATRLMRRTVEPQIALLRDALDCVTPDMHGALSDDLVRLELDLAREILRADGWDNA